MKPNLYLNYNSNKNNKLEACMFRIFLFKNVMSHNSYEGNTQGKIQGQWYHALFMTRILNKSVFLYVTNSQYSFQ